MTSTSAAASWDVFVSYSRADSTKVEQVVQALRTAGLSVWFDRTSVLPGERFREKIVEAIAASAVVLAFVSENAKRSSWASTELDDAMQREIRERRTIVVPVLLGRIRMEDLPSNLQNKHAFDFRHNFDRKWTDAKVEFVRLITALVKGEAQSAGGLVTLQVGDPLIQFFSSYWFRYKNEPAAGIFSGEIGKMGRALAMAFLAKDKGEPANDASSSEAPPRNDDTKKGPFKQDWSGNPPVERFVQRYGEYGLQQMFLYFIETKGLSLTGGFEVEDLIEVANRVETMVHLFEIFFTLESIRANEVKLLITLFGNGDYSIKGIGGEYIDLKNDPGAGPTVSYKPPAKQSWSQEDYLAWLGQNEPKLVQPLGQLLEESKQRGVLIGSVDTQSPALILVAARDERIATISCSRDNAEVPS